MLSVLLLVLAAPYSLDGAAWRDQPGPLVLDLGDGLSATLRASVSLRAQDLAKYSQSNPVDGVGFIDWRWPAGGRNTDGLSITLSRPVSSFTLEAGDWGSDDDGQLELTAWSCDRQLLATTTVPWPITRDPPFATLTVKAQGICQVRYRSGGPHAGSTFITRLRADAALLGDREVGPGVSAAGGHPCAFQDAASTSTTSPFMPATRCWCTRGSDPSGR